MVLSYHLVNKDSEGKPMPKILVVDDEKPIRDLIKLTLEIEQYEVVEAEDGEQAVDVIENMTIDLILLDIMLPKLDGYQVLQKIKHHKIPVIFLTAKISLQDKVLGLRMGADDYISKPFEPMELLARVESVLRRVSDVSTLEVDSQNELKFQDISMLLKERIVRKGDKEVVLTVKEFELLQIFLENKEIVLTREVLLDKVWGFDYFGNTRTIDVHVKQLREKLDLRDSLKTVYKLGYKLSES